MTIVMMALAMAAAGCGDLPNQMAMNECQSRAADLADRRMNEAWISTKRIMQKADAERTTGESSAGPGYAAALLSSQRAWLVFRDAECRVESYEWRGGTMQPYTDSQCRSQLTQERTKQLKDLAISIGR